MQSETTDFEPAVQELRRIQRGTSSEQKLLALNGLAALQLRKLVPLETRRRHGAFFTPSPVCVRVAAPLIESITEEAVVIDPACGAGDLLLPFVSPLSIRVGDQWVSRVYGWDTNKEFIQAARIRLGIAASIHDPVSSTAPKFINVKQASFFDRLRTVAKATHIVTNPPFVPIPTPTDCPWSTGQVNAAALFIDAITRHMSEEALVHAVLPDVLRSGARYSAWRRVIESRCKVLNIETIGKFDSSTDVDVFLLLLQKAGTVNPESAPWIRETNESSVSDFFRISVGAVVNNRDPHSGPWRPFLVAQDIDAGSEMKRIKRHRRFSRSVVQGPFVVVRRTSAPSQPSRAHATLITDDREVAVDNHLLVLRPHTGGLDECVELMKFFEGPVATEWLNERIRCRHLTVGALGGVPWAAKA
jgi:hypothetical protein